MTPAKLRLARAAMGQPETRISDLCDEIGVSRQILYRFVSPTGELREDGKRLLERRKVARAPRQPAEGQPAAWPNRSERGP